MTHDKQPISTRDLQALRIRIAVFLVSGVGILVAFGGAYRILDTIQTLDRAEGQRDTWQRPADVIRELRLTERSTIVDLGSGSGYFALKLSREVRSGRIFALDIRRLSLFFLS